MPNAALVIAALALASCSALVSPDTRSLEPQPVACEPGAVASCPCPDGVWHTQRCNAGGGYDPCACGDTQTAQGASTTDGNSGKGNNGKGRDGVAGAGQ